MTTLREAAEMALGTLQDVCARLLYRGVSKDAGHPDQIALEQARQTIQALKQATEQSKQKRDPIAWNGWIVREVLFDEGEPVGHRAPPQPEPEPVAWQRIETAPKTGRKVILFYLNRNNFPRTVMARWLTDDEAAETDTDCVGLEGGWYECIDNWDDYTEVAIHEGEPTHWMPLPPAPTSEGKPDVA